MGKRGPAKHPTALTLLHGTKNPSRINRNEPQPADLPVTKPDWLSDVAAEEWDRVAPHLEAMGVLTDLDQTALAGYCEAYARWRKLRSLAAETPPLLRGREGVMVKNPVFGQIRDADAAMIRWAREFGFTPSARTGIRVVHSVELPADRILNGSLP